MTERYSLEALRTLRDSEVDSAEAELRERLDTAARADDAARSLKEAHDAHVLETARVEREAKSQPQSANVFADVSRWHQKRVHEEKDLARKLDEAQAAHRACVREAEAARMRLNEARAAREAVEKHYDAWRVEQERMRDEKAEDEAQDIAQSKRSGSASNLP